MNKVRFHYPNPIAFDVDTDRDVDVYIDEICKEPIRKGNIRIVVLEEPRKGRIYRFYKENPRFYSYLLTFHEELMATSKRVRIFHFMNTWVRNYISNKEFSVSTVVGGKNDKKMEGYALRHELWRNRERIKVPRKFYLSGNAKHSHTFVPWDEANYEGELVLGASKEPMFDSMFHIAIENTSIHNYFSEKLTDCFQSKTVPIYYGCINISEYFNTTGMLIARNIDDIIHLCNGLTPRLYEEMLPAIEDNFEKSKRWLDPKEQMERGIKQILSQL